MLALVLGGGGSAGIGWETGVLHGLVAGGIDVTAAATVVGTSAGAVVGARLRSGADPARSYDAVFGEVADTGVDVDYPELTRRWAAATDGATSAEDARRRIADMALRSATTTPGQRRAQIAAMLPAHTWPDAPFAVVAVNGATGALVALTRDSGVGLVDAIAASCAVPGVWPPVVVGGAPHVDGAVRSPTNADLAAGCDRVIVVAPMLPATGLERELRRLPAGTRCSVVTADARARRAFGDNPLDQRTAPAAARHGHRQGAAAAARVRDELGG